MIYEQESLSADELTNTIRMIERILSTLNAAEPTPTIRLARELYTEQLQQLRLQEAKYLEQNGDFPSRGEISYVF